MPISLEQWRLAIGLWNARIQRTLVIRRGVKRAPSCQEGSPSTSLQSHSGEKMFKTKKKARKKHKDDTFGHPVVATDNFCNALIVLGASTTMCSGENECGDGSFRSPVAPLLELLECSVLGALLVIMMLLLRSGDVESNPGPVEGGASSLLDVGSKPTLEELDKLLVGCCSGWEQAVLCLGVQSLVIETENWNNPSNAEEAYRGVLRRWLLHAPGTGETERTWHSVLEALETSGHSQLAEQLKREHFVDSSKGPVNSAGASSLLDVGSKPTLEELDKLIVGRCSGWEQAALRLGVQSLVIETENWNNPSNAEEACRGVLHRWLLCAPGTGETERTWHSVLEALETSGHSQLAEQLKRDHFAESSEGRPIPVMSVGASSLLDVGSKPTLEELDKLIVGCCSVWEQTALRLGVQSLVIETENWNNPSNAEEAYRGVLRRWLLQAPGTGETERTWHSVLEALETSGHSQLTEQLKREHFPFSQPVVSVGDQKCDIMLRTYVSRVGAGKGRAVLEGLGLPEGMREMCFMNNPLNVEEAIQCGLLQWKNGHGYSPTWDVLLRAISYAEIPVQDVQKLKEEILKGPDEGLTSGLKDKKQKFPYGSHLAQEYFESVIDTYSDMAITGDDPHVDYVGLKVSESHPSQHKKEDTVQFLRNFQKATVDFISQHDADDPHITQTDEATSGLLTHDHFLQQHKKRLHIVFGPPGAGKTSFSRQICSKFASNPQSSSHSLILLFHMRDKKVAEAKSLRELLSCYSLPSGDSAYDELAQLVEKNRGRGVQISFDGLDEHQGLLNDSTSIVSKLIQGELKEAQIMVTSRPGIVMQLSKLFNRATLYEVQGFGPEEVKEYVESFFRKKEDPSAASKFLSALANRPDLTGSTYIPLNLWLLCSVFSFNNRSLPDTLTQCYTILFAQLLQHQAKKEELGTRIRPTLDGLPKPMQSMLNCLCQLSYQGFLDEILVFDEEMVINTCLASQVELKDNFDGMGLLHVHPKKHGVMDHLTFNFLHSTYQEYLCAKHIHGMSKEEQTRFWKKNISNPRYAMVFRFYCGLSQLQIKGVQDVLKGQELPRSCHDHDRRLLFLFYALHESGNTHLTASIASQLDRALVFRLKMSSYDFYVTGHCLSKAVHLTKVDFWTHYTQETTDAIPCIASVASSNPLVSLDLALTELSLLDAKRLTSALSALEELTLKFKAPSGDAVEKVLFIPTLKKLDLTVRSASDWHTSLHPKSQSGVAHLDLDLPSKGLANCCFQMEELTVECDNKDAGDVIAAHLPKCKNLRKVQVQSMNPVPILMSARSCDKLQKVVIEDPNHCRVPADDGSEVSADLSARHLRRLKLQGWGRVDSEVLKTCFSIVSSYSSLEELEVECDTPDAGYVIAAHLPKWKNLRKVQVEYMNPVPILLSARSCDKLDEVVIRNATHCMVPADDGSEVSADLSARHLRRLELQRWSGVDSEVLKTCFSIVSSYSSLEELEVHCNTPDAGDVLASHLPKWKNLRRVKVEDMNPVPMLLSTVSCGKLAEVVIVNPKHSKVPTGDGSVSIDLSAAHLRRLELRWTNGDGSEVLRTCLSIVSRCSSLEELAVLCNTPDAGDVLASYLPKWKNLRKVKVKGMNPVPMLLSTVSCGKLAEVVIVNPKHCKVPTGDGSVSVDISAAHLRRLELRWTNGGDSEVLRTCLSIVSSYSSLEELNVWCDTPDAGDVIASHLPKLKNLRKVTLRNLNPMPILLSVRLCGKLDEVIISYPKQCKPTAEDWQAVAVTMASAQQIKKMELWEVDVPFLEACLPSLSSCPSLQELRVHSEDPSAGQVLADSVLLLRGVETLSICDINPMPVLQVLSRNANHSVSSMGISLEEQPDWLVGVSDLLSQCRTIRFFQLYLNKGPEALAALSHCLEGLCRSPSIEDVSICCLDAGAGPAVAQLLPNVVGRLLRFSVSLPDPTEVLSVLQDSSLDHFELVTPHMVHMTPHDQVRLRTLVSRVKSGQVSVVTQQERHFPYYRWIDPNLSLGPAETLCVCAGLSKNPHIRGAEVSGVPPGLVSEVQRLLKTASCHSVTVNRETVRQVEPCTAPTLELSHALRMLPTGGFPSRSLLQRGRLEQGVLHKPTEEDQVPYELGVD